METKETNVGFSSNLPSTFQIPVPVRSCIQDHMILQSLSLPLPLSIQDLVLSLPTQEYLVTPNFLPLQFPTNSCLMPSLLPLVLHQLSYLFIHKPLPTSIWRYSSL